MKKPFVCKCKSEQNKHLSVKLNSIWSISFKNILSYRRLFLSNWSQTAMQLYIIHVQYIHSLMLKKTKFPQLIKND